MKVLTIFLSLILSLNVALANESDDVKAWAWQTQQGADCDQDPEWWVTNEPVEKIEHKYKNEWSTQEETHTMYMMLCYAGAYNFSYLMIEKNDFVPGGYRILNFATPVVEWEWEEKYVEEIEMNVEVVKDWSLVGMATTDILGSPEYDAKTGTITTFFKGRGIGDAYDSQTYSFQHGSWNLTRSEIDPSFDGDITPYIVFGK